MDIYNDIYLTNYQLLRHHVVCGRVVLLQAVAGAAAHKAEDGGGGGGVRMHLYELCDVVRLYLLGVEKDAFA